MQQNKPYRCTACNLSPIFLPEKVESEARTPVGVCSKCGSAANLSRLNITHLVVEGTADNHHYVSEFYKLAGKNPYLRFPCKAAQAIIAETKQFPVSHSADPRVVTCEECLTFVPAVQAASNLE